MKFLRYSAASVLVAMAASACAGMTQDDTDVGTFALGAGATDPNVVHGERYIVRLNDTARGRAAVRAAGGKIALDVPSIGAVAAYLPSGAAAALASNAAIADVEIDPKRYPLAQTTPYGIAMVQADRLSDAAAANVTACIIDSGLAIAHEDLPKAPKVTASPANGAGDPETDKCGHGTHVAGTIAAINNDVGVVGVNGGDQINLHIVKVFGDDCGWAYASSLVNALDECLSDSPTQNVVINMSLGGGQKSRSEEIAFGQAYATGTVISVAAAGNDGSTRKSYPASYGSVISVAAIDAGKTVASFSQQNSSVELAAPGVSVLSTMMAGSAVYTPPSSLDVAGTSVATDAMEGSPDGTVTANLADCGPAVSTCTGVSGAICLIARGTNSFAEKVQNCEAGGGVGAVIYNNVSGALNGTLNGVATGIPSVGISDTDGASLLGQLGASATLVVDGTANYSAISGTSMATPHVTGGAALLWSSFPWLSNADIRGALSASAEDLGPAGFDNAYGNGLIQLADAFAVLSSAGGCTGDADCDDGNPCNGAETCDGSGACASGAIAPAGTACADDGNVCNGAEACDGSGACASGGALTCGSGEVCDPSLGCVAAPSCKPAGDKCKGGSECCSGTCWVGLKGGPQCG